MKTQASERARARSGKQAHYAARNKAGNRKVYVSGLSGEILNGYRKWAATKAARLLGNRARVYLPVLKSEWNPQYDFEIVE